MPTVNLREIDTSAYHRAKDAAAAAGQTLKRWIEDAIRQRLDGETPRPAPAPKTSRPRTAAPTTTDAVAPTTPGRGKVTTAKAEPKPTTEGWINPFAKGVYGTKKGRDILSD